MKSLYQEVFSLDDYLEGKMMIKEGELELNHIKWQVEGNTIVHMACSDPDELRVVINYLQNYGDEYITAILLKNNQGKTPLDI